MVHTTMELIIPKIEELKVKKNMFLKLIEKGGHADIITLWELDIELINIQIEHIENLKVIINIE